MRTYQAKPADVTRKWYVLDASQVPLGRLSTVAARLLIGKDKPSFTRHIDVGDFVIVTNADQLVVTGQKAIQKIYYSHSHYPGGLSEKSLTEAKAKDSTKVVIHAIRGMLPVNKLRDARLMRLKVYTGSDHKHEAQHPETLNLKGAK